MQGIKGSGKAGYLGPQPFTDLVRADGRNLRHVASKLGFDYSYVLRVACGRVAPSAEFRRALVELLDQPLERLFTQDAINATYRQSRGLPVVAS